MAVWREFLILLLALPAASLASASEVTFGSQAYGGIEDLPLTFAGLEIEDFEDGTLSLHGPRIRDQGSITARVLGPSATTYSVDPGGSSFGPVFEFIAPVSPALHQSFLEFSFDNSALVRDRHAFGFALTWLPEDAHFSVQVLDRNGALLGESGLTIAETRSPVFWAIESSLPIGSIKLRSGTQGKPSFFQVDHLVFEVPESTSFETMVIALLAFHVGRLRSLSASRRDVGSK